MRIWLDIGEALAGTLVVANDRPVKPAIQMLTDDELVAMAGGDESVEAYWLYLLEKQGR